MYSDRASSSRGEVREEEDELGRTHVDIILRAPGVKEYDDALVNGGGGRGGLAAVGSEVKHIEGVESNGGGWGNAHRQSAVH